MTIITVIMINMIIVNAINYCHTLSRPALGPALAAFPPPGSLIREGRERIV